MAKEISQAKFFKVFAKTNGRCFYCNEMAEEIDHFVSRSFWRSEGLEEGLNDIENLVPACKRCNIAKSSKAPEDFIGNSYLTWNRSWRANKRVGSRQEDPWPVYSYKPFMHHDWMWFLQKYGS